MPKTPPYDRVKNANNNSDVFIKTAYWTPEVEDAFESWLPTRAKDKLTAILGDFLGSDVAISFKTMNGSCCCTLASQANREANLPYLLTGWSDNWVDAMYVAIFKLEVQLKGVWEAPPPPKASHRH